VNKNEEKSLKRLKNIHLPQRRFGFIAIEKGFIKADKLYKALMRQKAQENGGAERRPLGMTLKDLSTLPVMGMEFSSMTVKSALSFMRVTKKMPCSVHEPNNL